MPDDIGGLGAALLGMGKKGPLKEDDTEQDMDVYGEALNDAASQLMSAFEAKDPNAVADALRSAFSACQRQDGE